MQEKFADIEVVSSFNPQQGHLTNGDAKANQLETMNVIEALLGLALQPASSSMLDARLAACECLKAFFAGHSGIRAHFLRRAIEGHIGGDDKVPNILTVLIEPPESRGKADPYQSWLASVLLFHLVFEDPETKAMAMKVTEGDASSGEEVISCVQAITGNLITGMQRGDDERISVGYLMLLCGWLYEDPDVVNDLLGEGSSIQSLMQEAKQSNTSTALVSGLCAVILGIIYEFSSKDSPISRATLHQLLTGRLGREQYMDKITRLRELPLVRDFEVLPQTSQGDHDGGFPEVFFDKTFIDFLKDNFSRLVRAIDRDLGLEVPVIANGIQKGISRELVDSLRAQVEDRGQNIQKLESEMLTLSRKFEQEQLDHRKTKESTSLELGRLKQTNETLHKRHEEELTKLHEGHKTTKNDLLRQHGEQLRAIDSQLKQASAEYERKASKVRERNEAEVADLKANISNLEANLSKLSKDHIQDLQTAHEEYSVKLSTLEARSSRAEEKADESDERASKAEQQLKDALAELEKFQQQCEEGETARKAAQGELEDLLIVFGDLETKRNEDKVCYNASHLLGFHTNSKHRNDSKTWARMCQTTMMRAMEKTSKTTGSWINDSPYSYISLAMCLGNEDMTPFSQLNNSQLDRMQS